jgi:MSHA pilin protein MshA
MLKRAIQKGFTLIELVVVIVILGILAAVAAPKFLDLSSQAYVATQQGACGALASAAVMLYASTKTVNTCANIEAQTTTTNITWGGTCGAPTAKNTNYTGSASNCSAIDTAICSGSC